MDDQTLDDRAVAVLESDALCEGCGADPRRDDAVAIRDPRWFIDTVLEPDGFGDFTALAQIRCPKCW